MSDDVEARLTHELTLIALDAEFTHARSLRVMTPMGEERFTDVYVKIGKRGVLMIARDGRVLAWFSKPWQAGIT